MALTYTLIASSTVGSGGASSITFSSIPSTYTDLIVKVSGRNSATSSQLLITVNGSTADYSGKRLFNNVGTSAASTNTNTANLNPSGGVGSGFTANTFGNTEIYIPNYTSANFKSFSIDGTPENNAVENYNTIVAGLWSNTAAITSIGLVASGGNFVQYSTATLYGIKNS
jgi:hypothetical protein